MPTHVRRDTRARVARQSLTRLQVLLVLGPTPKTRYRTQRHHPYQRCRDLIGRYLANLDLVKVEGHNYYDCIEGRSGR